MKNFGRNLGVIAVAAIIVFTIVNCATVNPETKPVINVEMYNEVFRLDPGNPDAPQPVAKITVRHPAPIKDWTIQVQPIRQEAQGAQQSAARPAGQDGEQRRTSRGPFYELKGTKRPPNPWTWDGKSTREPRAGGTRAMVQSATDYQLTVTVNDIYDNTATYEGTLSVDVLVRLEDDNHLRIVVPSIIFPPNSANFGLLSEADMRADRRVLRLIANALNRYPKYKVLIEGHSNPTTPPNTPQRTNEETRELKPLSEARAKAVLDYLVENHQIDRGRLRSIGIGGERTVAQYDDPDENSNNRRVEFILEL